ncbi:zinc finger MYM-type protein 1-like protein [Tanacetum coccineum]
MSLCLRNVNKKGVVVECFIGVVHVKGTTTLTLKKEIHSLLADHSLSTSKIRGQAYDRASNMKGEINGLKTLILKESPSAEKDERFIGLKNVGELSLKLVELKKYTTYDLVYLLIKLVLILPVETASVERTFSAMIYVKNKLRNNIGDQFLNNCLVTYIEKDVFSEVSDDTIMAMFGDT